MRCARSGAWTVALLAAAAVPAGAQQTAEHATARVSVRVENPLALERPDEVIELSWAALRQRLPGLDPARVRALDAATLAELPTQAVDSDGDGRPDQLLVLVDLQPSQARDLVVEPRAPGTPPRPRAYARHIEERDDVAWESDRIAYRIYGQGLWKQENLHSSGIDVWVKRTRDLIVDRWYAKGHDSYHRDTGEGADFYTVGPSLGAGGDAIWRDGRLYAAENFRSWRVLAAGPVRAIFELTYDPFDAGGLRVSETRRFVMDAGQNLFRVETTFHVDSAVRDTPLTYAIGFVKHADGQVAASSWTAGGRVWLSTWQPVEKANGGHGELGLGLLLDRASLREMKETDDHTLALATAIPERPAVRYVGAGWTASGDFPDVRSWWRALDALAERLASPLRVTILGDSTGESGAAPSSAAYLGQAPPGEVAVPFGAGVLGGQGYFAAERVAVSPEGTEIYYCELQGYARGARMRVRVVRYEAGRWIEPALVADGMCNPAFSFDGRLLIVQDTTGQSWTAARTATGLAPFRRFLQRSVRTHYLQQTRRGFYASSPSARGDMDISSVVVGPGDTAIVSLGAPVNTDKADADFYIAPDESYMILASPNRGGFGSGDLFVSYPARSGGWSEPRNLGSAVNSSGWEWGPAVTPDGRYLIFSRMSGPADSAADRLYWIRIDHILDSLRAEP